jgi:hypothetical protein
MFTGVYSVNISIHITPEWVCFKKNFYKNSTAEHNLKWYLTKKIENLLLLCYINLNSAKQIMFIFLLLD